MIQHTTTTGTRGLLRVDDNTDSLAGTVDLYVASSAPISVDQLPWSYSVDGVASDLKAFRFKQTTAWQHLGLITINTASTFTLHLGKSGTPELGGPTDLVVQLANTRPTVSIKVGNVWVKAKPYVRVDGAWKPASAWVAYSGLWQQAR